MRSSLPATGRPPISRSRPYRPDGSDSDLVGICVRDRGPGIAPEHAERIFQLFQRAVGREVEGTGAGLAIVRQIAERHGGNAWVAQSRRRVRIYHYVLPRPSSGRRYEPMIGEPMEILLVEDNEDDILLEQEALADANLVNLISVVRDGEEALNYLRR